MKDRPLPTGDALSNYYRTQNPRTNAYYDQFHQRQAAYSGTLMWNWSAFFGTLLWLLYRRSYYACALSLLGMGLLLFSLNLWGLFLVLITPILFGLFGNNLYFWNLKLRAAAGASTGGTSWKALSFSLLIFFPLTPFVFFICALLGAFPFIVSLVSCVAEIGALSLLTATRPISSLIIVTSPYVEQLKAIFKFLFSLE